METYEPIWRQPSWIARSQLMLDSYEYWLGTPLLPRTGDLVTDAQHLFEAECVVVAHGREADPILNYGNARALSLWELSPAEFLQTPSRKTAEPVHRDERARMLERTMRDGYIDDYQGIRVTATGKRFLIRQAVVWNIVDETGQQVGQAATFSEIEFL